MAKRIIKLTFPPDLVKQPLVFQMAKKFDIMPNIRRARVTENTGEMVLELEGKEADLDSGVAFLKKAGVIVEPVVGNIVE